MKLSSIMTLHGVSNSRPNFINEAFHSNEETPCRVEYNHSWLEGRNSYEKSFVFSVREPLKSFCNYILDFESQFGLQFDLIVYSSENKIDLKVPSYQIGNKINSVLSKIDSVYLDVKESYLENE